MNKKLQVFVSSTYTDLTKERQAAVEAILDAGHIPAGMELFKAGKSQMKTIKKWIDESDVYMLILGGRYGSIEEDSGLSYTELEYNYALSKEMPVFAIVLSDKFLHSKASQSNTSSIFENKNKLKYELFKTHIKENIVRFVDNIDQIPSAIHSQLNYIMTNEEYNLVGWIRANALPSNNSSSDNGIFPKNEPTFSSSKTLLQPARPKKFDKRDADEELVFAEDAFSPEFYDYINRVTLRNLSSIKNTHP